MKQLVRYTLFAGFMGWLQLGFGQDVQQFALDDILQKAIYHSLDAKLAWRDYGVATANYQAIQSSWKPNLNFQASTPNLTTTFQETVQPNGSIAFQPVSQNFNNASLSLFQRIAATGGTWFINTDLQRFDDFENDFTRYNGSPIVVGISQPILGFNQIKWEQRVEPVRFAEAARNLNAALEDVKLQTVQLYFDILQAQLEVQIAQQNLASNDTLLTVANEKFSLGRISRNDLLQLELGVTRSTRDLQQAENNLQLARTALMRFSGLHQLQNTSWQVLIPEANSMVAWEEIDHRDFMIRNRPEYQENERLILEAQQNQAQTKREFGPSIFLNASLGVTRGGENLADVYTSPKTESVLQVSMNIPIWDWGRRKHQVEATKIQEQFAMERKAYIQQNLDLQLSDRISLCQQLEKEIRMTALVREKAEERFAIANESYILGSLTITELIIAFGEKDQAQREYLNTLRRYWSAYYQLRNLTLFNYETNEHIDYIQSLN